MRHAIMVGLLVFATPIGSVIAQQPNEATLAPDEKPTPMSPNKQTIERYMQGFRESDHAKVLGCLTDDVEWVIPGMFHARGKAAFDKEIENEAFVGRPEITVSRLVEEGDVVVAEGSVRSRKKDGGDLHVVFCDVFVMRDARIRHLTSYLMEVPERPK